jgi:hypothetical protein
MDEDLGGGPAGEQEDPVDAQEDLASADPQEPMDQVQIRTNTYIYIHIRAYTVIYLLYTYTYHYFGGCHYVANDVMGELGSVI